MEAINRWIEEALPMSCAAPLAQALTQLWVTSYNLRQGMLLLGWSDLGSTDLVLLMKVSAFMHLQ